MDTPNLPSPPNPPTPPSDADTPVSSAPTPTAPVGTPGWFPDPLGRYDNRYFNGSTWTADVSDQGQRRVDPLGTQPPADGGPRAHSGTGKATAALVLGIIAFLISWLPYVVFIGILLAIGALFLGFSARAKAKQGLTGGRGRATAGGILGILALLVGVIGVLSTIEVNQFFNPATNTASVDSCIIEDGQVSVTGTLTNTSTTSSSFTVFAVAPAPNFGDVGNVIVLKNVSGNEALPWALEYSTTDSAQRCEITIYGEFPFGRDSFIGAP